MSKIAEHLKTIPTKDLITAYNDFNDMENTGVLNGKGRIIYNDIMTLALDFSADIIFSLDFTYAHLKIAQELIKRYDLVNNEKEINI